MEYVPVDAQRIFEMLSTLIANYRDGQSGTGFYECVAGLSLEWERQGLPCVLPNHGRRDRGEGFHLKDCVSPTVSTDHHSK